MYHDLTRVSISRSLILFALPMMAGNLLQQSIMWQTRSHRSGLTGHGLYLDYRWKQMQHGTLHPGVDSL